MAEAKPTTISQRPTVVDPTVLRRSTKFQPAKPVRREDAVSANIVQQLLQEPERVADSTLLTKAELQELREHSHRASSASQREARSNKEAAKAAQAARAKEHKELLLRVDEQRGSTALEPSEMERERVAQANAVVEGARKKLQEQSQDVKRMNQMVLYAKCVAIRDKQLAEKEAAKKKQKEDERAADAAMEEARQKKAAEMAAREAKRLEANKKGCLEIISQMQQRERERMLQREQKEREAMRTVEEIRRREKEDAEERQRKFLAGKELLKETLEANNAALAAKQKRKQEAVDEDNRIAAYLRDKEKREQEKEEEEARRKAEKDRNIALIREKQQKAIDQQSAVDELRAKRYQEAEDRKWRERELAAARKRQQLIAEMRHSREQQLQDKQRRLLEQALQDKAEFEAMVKWQNEQAKQEAKATEERKEKLNAHREMLLASLQEKEESKRREKLKFNESGHEGVQDYKAEKARLEQIKAEKIAELEKAGVPDRYRVELAKFAVLAASPFK